MPGFESDFSRLNCDPILRLSFVSLANARLESECLRSCPSFGVRLFGECVRPASGLRLIQVEWTERGDGERIEKKQQQQWADAAQAAERRPSCGY